MFTVILNKVNIDYFTCLPPVIQHKEFKIDPHKNIIHSMTIWFDMLFQMELLY